MLRYRRKKSFKKKKTVWANCRTCTHEILLMFDYGFFFSSHCWPYLINSLKKWKKKFGIKLKWQAVALQWPLPSKCNGNNHGKYARSLASHINPRSKADAAKSTNTMAFINQYLLICHTDIIGKSGGNAKPFKYLLCDIVEDENILTEEGETCQKREQNIHTDTPPDTYVSAA